MRHYFLYLLPFFAACGGATTPGDGDTPNTAGDGDDDGDTLPGDGDMAPGDGDGDGDGDSTSPPGDGDGDTLPGDGDGDGDTLPGDGDGATGGMGGTMNGSGGGESGSGGTLLAGDAETYCTAVCETLETPPGSCADIYVCGEEGQCRQGADSWSETARGAFEWCYQNDYMCFITSEGCMLSHLFGVGAPLTHVVSGSGFDVNLGTTIGIAYDGVPPITATTLVQAGVFELEVDAPRFQDQANYLTLWLDVNGDGSCSEGDLVGSTRPEFNSDFDNPAAISEVGPADFSDSNHENCMKFF